VSALALTPAPPAARGYKALVSVPRRCPGCEREFIALRKNQRHCRPSCRRLALERRRALAARARIYRQRRSILVSRISNLFDMMARDPLVASDVERSRLASRLPPLPQPEPRGTSQCVE
jgi:hypothetical protein